jgi:hypothetical protein
VAEWTGLVAATITKHLLQREVNVLRKRVLLALMKKKGRITYNNSGKDVDWRVQFSRADIVPYADADTISFPRRNRYKVATLDWRGYQMAEAITKKERLMNSGKEAIIKLFSEKSEMMMSDFEERFCDELFIDGNSAANTRRIHGLESWFGSTSGTGDGGRTKDPSDTYAGLLTDLGNYGGSWSGDWPDGTGQVEYYFWSPILVSTDNTVWGATPSFAAYGDDQLRYGILKSKGLARAQTGSLDIILFNDKNFNQFLNLQTDKERIMVQRGEKVGLVSLGFTDAVQYEGVEMMWEYGVPASTIYGLNTEELELMSLQDRLFVSDGPTYVQQTMSYNVVLDFFGNLRGNPRNELKLYPYG